MPHKDVRSQATVTSTKAKRKTSGGFTVQYRDAKGLKHNATVVSAGTTSGLKLRVHNRPTSGGGSTAGGSAQVIDNVPVATSKTSVNSYFAVGNVGGF
jgi:hypothetical protein